MNTDNTFDWGIDTELCFDISIPNSPDLSLLLDNNDEENQETKKQLSRAQADLYSAIAINTVLQAKIGELDDQQEKIQDMQKSLSHFKSESEQLQSMVRLRSEQNMALQTEALSYRRHIAELQSKIQALTIQVEQLGQLQLEAQMKERQWEVHREAFKKELSDNRSAADRLVEIHSLREQKAKDTCAALEEQEQQMAKKCSSLQDRVNELLSQLERQTCLCISTSSSSKTSRHHKTHQDEQFELKDDEHTADQQTTNQQTTNQQTNNQQTNNQQTSSQQTSSQQTSSQQTSSQQTANQRGAEPQATNQRGAEPQATNQRGAANSTCQPEPTTNKKLSSNVTTTNPGNQSARQNFTGTKRKRGRPMKDITAQKQNNCQSQTTPTPEQNRNKNKSRKVYKGKKSSGTGNNSEPKVRQVETFMVSVPEKHLNSFSQLSPKSQLQEVRSHLK